jgi:hypothetical protein
MLPYWEELEFTRSVNAKVDTRDGTHFPTVSPGQAPLKAAIARCLARRIYNSLITPKNVVADRDGYMRPAMIAAGNDPLHDAVLLEPSIIIRGTTAIRQSGLPDHIAVRLRFLMEDDGLQIFQLSMMTKYRYAYWPLLHSQHSFDQGG